MAGGMVASTNSVVVVALVVGTSTPAELSMGTSAVVAGSVAAGSSVAGWVEVGSGAVVLVVLVVVAVVLVVEGWMSPATGSGWVAVGGLVTAAPSCPAGSGGIVVAGSVLVGSSVMWLVGGLDSAMGRGWVPSVGAGPAGVGWVVASGVGGGVVLAGVSRATRGVGSVVSAGAVVAVRLAPRDSESSVWSGPSIGCRATVVGSAPAAAARSRTVPLVSSVADAATLGAASFGPRADGCR
jgi:hypothetical protein